MQELYEFRLSEEYAAQLFGPGEGRKLGEFGPLVRQIFLPVGDPKIRDILRLSAEIRRFRSREVLWSSCVIHRTYNDAEISNAELFVAFHSSIFEPAGEECGTTYQESRACSFCGAGAPRIGPLALKLNRVPKRTDFATSIAGEFVASRRVVDLFRTGGFKGAHFYPVRSGHPDGPVSDWWHDVAITSATIEIASQTVTGNDPFDLDDENELRCPRGDLIGRRPLSEVFVKRHTLTEGDIFSSQQFFGGRSGLLRPFRLTFVSPRLRKDLVDNDFRGLEFEIARIA